MEFSGLNAQYERLQEELKSAVVSVLDRGQFILGDEVNRLEQNLAQYVGRKHCIAVSSGTDALLMCLMAEGIGKGDCVLTTPFTFFATAEAISLTGATPVFVDINPDTYNIDPYCLGIVIKRIKREGLLTPRAVIAVDLFGLPAEYEKLENICSQHNLVLIEDAAQSFGAQRNNRKTCSFGKYAATSFFPAKPLGCYGDGGAVFCDCDEVAEILRSIRVHGQGENKYDNLRIGLNARLDEIQAAILNVKLKVFDSEIQERQRVANSYKNLLNNIVKTPREYNSLTNAYAQYTIAFRDKALRDFIYNGLLAQGIPCNIYYPTPLHLQPAYSDLQFHTMPNAEYASERVLSLPMHAYLTQQDIQLVCSALKELLSQFERESDNK